VDLQRRHRREMEDLRDDAMRVGKDVYQTAIVELEEMHEHVDTADIAHLLKRILRNIDSINATLESLESTRDFLQDFSPISRELFLDTMHRLDELDRKGYFEFMAELLRVGDTVVTSYSREDVRRLGENIVTILETVKNLSQQDVLMTVNNALRIYRQLDTDVPDEVSTWQLVREINTPETRRGIAMLLRFQRNLLTMEQAETTTDEPLAREGSTGEETT